MLPRAEPWGVTAEGRPVELWTLVNAAGLQATIATWGATLVSLVVPCRDGERRQVVLGFDALEGYLGEHPYVGAAVGRYANRIARGRFRLDGVEHRLVCNDGDHHLHGGRRGLSRIVWDAVPGEGAEGPWLRLSCVSPDGDEGYPGTLGVSLCYTLGADGLRLDWAAASDRPTPVNLTHHAYFNLAGGGHVLAHRLRLYAERFLPVDADLIPTGEMRPVAGTAMDFREPMTIGARIELPDPQLRLAGGYDHCWELADAPGTLRPAAELHAPDGRLSMRMWTTEPGLQCYAGNRLDGTLGSRGGRGWPRHGGLCLEAQHFPDSPNRPAFPDTVIRPGATYRQTTGYAFG